MATESVPCGCDHIMQAFMVDMQHSRSRLRDGMDAAATLRVNGADAYLENLRYAHLRSSDRLSQADAFAFRTASETGAGRTRLEINPPSIAVPTTGGGIE